LKALRPIGSFRYRQQQRRTVLWVPLFPPGEIQSIYFFERESSNVWRYYSLARTGKQASLLIRLPFGITSTPDLL
jgi:hypothetical protein